MSNPLAFKKQPVHIPQEEFDKQNLFNRLTKQGENTVNQPFESSMYTAHKRWRIIC